MKDTFLEELYLRGTGRIAHKLRRLQQYKKAQKFTRSHRALPEIPRPLERL